MTNVRGMASRCVIAFLCALVVSACGGGGGSNGDTGNVPTSADEFIIWSGNENGAYILDGAGQQFARTMHSDQVFAISIGNYLSGLTFGDNSSVLYNGNQIALVVLDFDSNDRKVAYLACSGPAPNYGKMTITVTNLGWTYSCASNTGSGSDSGTGGDGVNASHCIDVTSNNGSYYLYNACNVSVYVSWCIDDDVYWNCGPSNPIGDGLYNYSRGTWGIGPGNSYPLQTPADGRTVRLFACAKGPSGIEPLVSLTNLEPPQGVCR